MKLVPKPKSRSQYCAVCRYHYDDYLDHIKDTDHKKNIRKCSFCLDIDYLSRLIKEETALAVSKAGMMTRSVKRRMDSEWVGCEEMKGSKKCKYERGEGE